MDYLKSGQKRDVVFIVEGKTIPALKSFLSEKSRVFRAMFSGNFKESKDKVIVIEDTTYWAFRAFLQFLYSDNLVFYVSNDFKLIGQLFRLSDRYDVSRLRDRILVEFNKRYFSSELICLSDEEFEQKWPKIRSISRLAIDSQILELNEKVIDFIDTNFEYFLKKDIKELSELNDLTDGIIFEIMANKCKKFCEFEPWLLQKQRKKKQHK